jgi:pSer/pThr/pTyr-binding forkhead associated (FHA) protein
MSPPGSSAANREAFPPGDFEPFDESTTLSTRRSKPQYWTLTLPNGRVELVTDRVVIGRQPEYMPALPSARLIPVPDPTRSVSKNHACFSLSGANLVVEDLGSTNGIIVTRPDGHELDIGVRGRTELEAGARVELGDVVLTIGKV